MVIEISLVLLFFIFCLCVGTDARRRYNSVQGLIPASAQPTIDAWLKQKGTNL